MFRSLYSLLMLVVIISAVLGGSSHIWEVVAAPCPYDLELAGGNTLLCASVTVSAVQLIDTQSETSKPVSIAGERINFWSLELTKSQEWM